MSKIIIAGAGGTPSENVIKSLLECEKGEDIIGIGSEPTDLMLSQASKRYCIPYAVQPNYKKVLLKILSIENPDLIHFQNDLEIREASKFRDEIQASGVKLFMPSHDVIEKCVDKGASYKIWESQGLKVPKTYLINNEDDLKRAFDRLANSDGMIWIRSTVGGGGKGALPTNDFQFAKLWINRFKGWGSFMAAELLSPNSVTWLSIWFNGELVVAQTIRRRSWNFGKRTLSVITGIT